MMSEPIQNDLWCEHDANSVDWVKDFRGNK